MTTYTAEGRRGGHAKPTTDPHPATCGCPVCAGLHTFVRPRFFAGQLLTDTELTTLTGYVSDKLRLHNRYLHGYGVVCGLQVECDGCGPGVIVRPGYALDQCGNDLVLPDAVSIPVDKLIAACAPHQHAADCDPPRYASANGCEDREQTWCLWVRYREQQARPVTPLGGTAASGCGCGGKGTASPRGGGSAGTRSSGCGCGGAPKPGSSGCGCGGASASRATTCGCSNAPAQTSRPPACEPSRIYEYVEFGVAPSDGSCDELSTAIGGTFPAKVVDCITHLRPVLTTGMSKNLQSSALSMASGGTVGLSTGAARDALCQLYANVVELYRKDPMRTQCVLPEELQQLDCSPQGPNETDNDYRVRLATGFQQLIMLVLLYLRDCVCYAVLPPCPGPACDDRVVLACLTVVDGVVTKICNHACRKYAGSFVNREYWLPIGPVLSLLAAKLCCFPLSLPRLPGREQETKEPTRWRATNLRRFDNVLGAVRADDFALLGLWRQRAKFAVGKASLGGMLAAAERALDASKGSVRLASYLHADAAVAAESLAKKGVQVRVVEVEEPADGLAFDAIPRVAEGGNATLYVLGGRVVGVRGSEGLRLFGRKLR